MWNKMMEERVRVERQNSKKGFLHSGGSFHGFRSFCQPVFKAGSPDLENSVQALTGPKVKARDHRHTAGAHWYSYSALHSEIFSLCTFFTEFLSSRLLTLEK